MLDVHDVGFGGGMGVLSLPALASQSSTPTSQLFHSYLGPATRFFEKDIMTWSLPFFEALASFQNTEVIS